MEAFIGLLTQTELDGHIHGVQVAAAAPSISHLCFADDTMVFCRATPSEAAALKHILNCYASASGQVINFEKSSMTFSKGMGSSVRDQIANILGVQVVENHDRYLGMPAVIGKSKQQIFSIIRDRVWRKINGWGERSLSSAGKEVLIKAVLQSIPTYIMSCFSLPGYLIRDIEVAIRRFWWDSGTKKKLAWTSWAKLCQAKDK